MSRDLSRTCPRPRGMLDERAAAAAAHRLGGGEDVAARQELDPRRGADLTAVRERMAARL